MYTVYMHITPNNKRYIGITCRTLNKRFGSNGVKYKSQLFGRAIKKYGWDNIQHIVICDGLTKEHAEQLEKDLIAEYQTTNPEFGYNVSIGGNVPAIAYVGHKHTEETKRKIGKANANRQLSEETRAKISEKIKALWDDPTYREKQLARVVSTETREKQSQAHKGKTLPKSQKLKISMNNKGKHCMDDEHRTNISKIVKAQHAKEKALGIKRNYSNGGKAKGTKWYNNGVINVRSGDGCPIGFVPGRLHFDYSKNRKSRKGMDS